jgi:SAM-dependent methyltransferase
MPSLVQHIDRALYPGIESNWDDAFLRRSILGHLSPQSVILDLGAGAGVVTHMNFRGLAARVCGVDVDARVVSNPMLDEGKVGDAERIPYDDTQFDLVFADNVLEHLQNPAGVFKEVARVLKPGGVFIFKTPNRHHYMAMVSRLTPHRFHQIYNSWRGREEADTFPTHYRANTRGDVTRLAQNASLLPESVSCIEGRPEYLRLTAATYIVGAIYERIVNAIPALEAFRIALVGVMRKPNL